MMTSKPLRGIQLNTSRSLADGLIGAWLFNEGIGTTVFDLSHNSNHGSMENIAFPATSASGWSAGDTGFGLRFNGTDDCVDVSNTDSLDVGTDDFTYVVRFKVDTLAASQIVVCNGRTLTDGKRSTVGLASVSGFYTVVSTIDDNASPVSCTAGTIQLSVDTWYTGAVVRNGDDLVVYVDGIQNASIGGVGSMNPDSDKSLTIGTAKAQADDSDYAPFDGVVDFVYLYGRALTAVELLKLHRDPYSMF